MIAAPIDARTCETRLVMILLGVPHARVPRDLVGLLAAPPSGGNTHCMSAVPDRTAVRDGRDVSRQLAIWHELPRAVGRPGAEPTARGQHVQLVVSRLLEHIRGRIHDVLERRISDRRKPRRPVGGYQFCWLDGNDDRRRRAPVELRRLAWLTRPCSV